VDVFGGYKWGFAKDWILDLGLYHYRYPGTYDNLGAFSNPDTTEAYLGVSYAWASLKYSRVLSDACFGVTHANGTSYADLSLAVPLGESGWTVLLHGGRTTFPAHANPVFFFNGSRVTGDNSLFSYSDFKLGIATRSPWPPRMRTPRPGPRTTKFPSTKTPWAATSARAA